MTLSVNGFLSEMNIYENQFVWKDVAIVITVAVPFAPLQLLNIVVRIVLALSYYAKVVFYRLINTFHCTQLR